MLRTKSHFDFLIIGQGLAGSALAWQLIQAGQRVLVIDDKHRDSSSNMAAGLINPLAGRRFKLSPELPDCFSHAMQCYSEFEQHFGEPFWHPLAMLRVLQSTQQQQDFEGKRQQAEYRGWISETAVTELPFKLQTPHGAFWQQQCGYVDMALLLRYLRDWLETRRALLQERFAAEQLQFQEDFISYKTLRAPQIVFCEGAGLVHNPWFKSLPLQLAKGEIIDVRITHRELDVIINDGHWLIPISKHHWRCGATHEHRFADLNPTEHGKQSLIAQLQRWLGPEVPIELVNHQAAARPGTPDRYPLLGSHAQHPNMHLFNGFGARGALTVPYYAQLMSRYLLEQYTLPENASLQRFDTT